MGAPRARYEYVGAFDSLPARAISKSIMNIEIAVPRMPCAACAHAGSSDRAAAPAPRDVGGRLPLV